MIELLVVLAIIGILAAILLPVLSSARESGRRAVCASNLKQMGLALMQYAQDNTERLPGAWVGPPGENKAGGWIFYSSFGQGATAAKFDPSRGSLYTYIREGGVYQCPSDEVSDSTGDSYSINSCLFTSEGDGYARARKLSSFPETSRLMLFSEESFHQESADDGYQLRGVNFFSGRHAEGSNVLFLDGHVKWHRVSDIVSQDLQTGGTGRCSGTSSGGNSGGDGGGRGDEEL